MDRLLKFWEVSDRPPQGRVDLVVGFTLPQNKVGGVSGVLENLIQTVARE